MLWFGGSPAGYCIGEEGPDGEADRSPWKAVRCQGMEQNRLFVLLFFNPSSSVKLIILKICFDKSEELLDFGSLNRT